MFGCPNRNKKPTESTRTRSFRSLRQTHEHDDASFELLLQLLKERQLIPAWTTPGRPHVDVDVLATEITERHLLAVHIHTGSLTL